MTLVSGRMEFIVDGQRFVIAPGDELLRAHCALGEKHFGRHEPDDGELQM